MQSGWSGTFVIWVRRRAQGRIGRGSGSRSAQAQCRFWERDQRGRGLAGYHALLRIHGDFVVPKKIECQRVSSREGTGMVGSAKGAAEMKKVVVVDGWMYL